jgi:hypothetical protein
MLVTFYLFKPKATKSCANKVGNWQSIPRPRGSFVRNPLTASLTIQRRLGFLSFHGVKDA